jgi:F-type H+-transporting ATPase subunit b
VEHFLTQFAAEPAKADLFSSIGIDWKLLVLQTIAFLLLLVILKKFVYPPIVAMLDRRDEKIKEAYEAADSTQQQVDSLLTKARSEATEIVSTAKKEAGAMMSEAEAKSKAQAKRTVQLAQDEIARDVVAARKMLYNETLELVASATEKVVGKTISKSVDEHVIEAALKEAR